MKYLPQIILSAIFVIAFILFLNNSTDVPTIIYSVDTVYSKPDTVLFTDTLIINKMYADLDTVYIDSTEIISAAADTTLLKDSSKISVKYFFPPLNYFEIAADLKERIITKTKTITEVQTVEKPNPFYSDHWFWSTVALILLLINNVVQ